MVPDRPLYWIGYRIQDTDWEDLGAAQEEVQGTSIEREEEEEEKGQQAGLLAF